MKRIALIFMLNCAIHAQAAPLACLIEPDKVAEVGSQVIGVLEKVLVERGDAVKEGQIVAQLNDDVERATVDVAEMRARAEAELKVALAAADLARVKAERAEYLVSVGFISKEAADQTLTEARIAQNRVAQAREAQRLSLQELVLSNSRLEQRRIRAPFSGIVVDRYRNEGERIEREPIVRIARIDPLRVEMVLPVSQFGRVARGAVVNLKTDVTGDALLPATVTLVDRVVDAASNTFRVRLRLPNPEGRIPAGLRCMAEFQAGEAGEIKPLATARPGIERTSFSAAPGQARQSPAQGAPAASH